MKAKGDKAKRRERLDLDVEALRRHLGPVKVALIEQWIREVVGPLDEAIAAVVPPEGICLDAGCSRGDPDLRSLANGMLYIGTDTDLSGLRANALADVRLCSGLNRMPFADASIDVIVLKWVAEHLDDPQSDFAECWRVLRPGGSLCVLTPNVFSLFTFISAAVPHRLKQVLKRWMFGLHEEDTFPTYYRANSRSRLRSLLREPGWQCTTWRYLPGMWTFFIFMPRVARAVRWLELMQMRLPPLRGTATYILGVWRKKN